MTITAVETLLFAASSGNAPTSDGSDDWMFVSAICAAMLLITLVVVLCVRRPR